MIHNYVRNDLSGDHWGTGVSQHKEVLVQLQKDGEQVRLNMSPEEAEHLARALLHRAEQAREAALKS